MMDFSHQFGEDLQLAEDGTLGVASGTLVIRQSVVRRLCTNPADYLWHLGYGAGLPARIGMPIGETEVRGLIFSQLRQEAGIDQNRAVNVILTELGIGIYRCAIAYTDLGEGAQTELVINQNGMG